ncbi:hypothetical protein [Pseudonocardia lacus]|uniref:hypothetical protein n=1 Tax=Pseudonocardia lacus TaxID=2835865 RepID=UPI001BDDBBC7|nr:hypothetical protein [Pseudonocardia lacus]
MIAAGIEFPHARQATQITRPVCARTGRKGHWRIETIYAITDLGPHQADLTSSPPGSAGTGKSRTVCTGSAMSPSPRTCPRSAPTPARTSWPRCENLVISLHRLSGATNIAKALRHHSRDARRPLHLLKID